jgi:stage V sporulation protein SpoVS
MSEKNIPQYIENEKDRIIDPAELRAASNTDAKKLAGAIYSKFREHGYVKIRAIGDAAIGAGFRACVIASGYLRQNDVNTYMSGAFFVVKLDSGETRNGTIINLEPIASYK